MSTEIVKDNTLESRLRTVAKFIEIADELHKLGNFNGVMEVITGLFATPVSFNVCWEVRTYHSLYSLAETPTRIQRKVPETD